MKLPRTILLLPFFVTLMTACGTAEDQAEGYFEKGKRLFNAGDFVKAELELKNALQARSDLAQAWYLLGEIREKRKEWNAAFQMYSKVKEIEPDHLEARVKRAKILLAAGQIEEAQEEAKWALGRQPHNTAAKILQAGIHVRKGELDAAESLANEALESDFASERNRRFLAQLFLLRERPDRAEALLHEGVRLNPNSVDLRRHLAALYGGLGKPREEVRVLKALLTLEPEQPEHYHQLAAALDRNGKPDEAVQVLRRRIAEDEKDWETKLLLIDFLAGRESPEVAEEELKRMIASDAAYELRLRLGGLYREMKRNQEAIDTYKAIRDENPANAYGVTAGKRLADTYLGAGEITAAKREIAHILDRTPNDGEALLVRAALALSEKDDDSAIADLRTVLQDRPDSLRAVELIVGAYIRKGEKGLAVMQLQDFIDANPAHENSYLQLARLHVLLKERAKAIRTLERMVKAIPGAASGYKALSELMLRTGQGERAIEYATQLTEIDPSNAGYRHFLGSVYQATAQHALAIAQFEKALETEPAAIQPLTALIKSLTAGGEKGEAVERLETVIEAHPNHFVAYNLLGELHLMEEKFDRAEKAFQKAKEINGRWYVPYLNLSALYGEKGDRGASLKILEEGDKATDGNSAILSPMANLLVRSGKTEAAISVNERLLERTPDQASLINNLAMLLTGRGRDKQALERAFELAGRFEASTNPVYRDTLGWIYYLKGQTTRAIGHLEYAVRHSQDNAEMQYHLAMAYLKERRTTEAKIYLEKALAQEDGFSGKEEAKRALKRI